MPIGSLKGLATLKEATQLVIEPNILANVQITYTHLWQLNLYQIYNFIIYKFTIFIH